MTLSEKKGAAPRPAALGAEEIKALLPHRYPFLLVDRILEFDAEHAVGLKNVTLNEPYFQGHFPGHAVMPGVLIIEAMAQVAGVASLRRISGTKMIVFLTGIDHARFRDRVLPGDQLRIETRLVKEKSNFHVVAGVAKVGDKIVCEAELMFMLIVEST